MNSPAAVECIGCRYCNLEPTRDKRSLLICTNQAVQTMPVDASKCFELEVPDHE